MGNIIESGDPVEGNAHDMKESPAHDLDCGPSRPDTFFAISINMFMSNIDPYWIFDPNHPNNPPRKAQLWSHGCDSFIVVDGAVVFNPPNLNTSSGAPSTQATIPAQPTDFGLDLAGNCFLVCGGRFANTATGEWFGTVSDGYNEPWGTLVANGVLNPLYIGPTVPWSDVPWPGPYALYGKIGNGGQGIGFHSGDSAIFTQSGQIVPAGVYLATIRAGFYAPNPNDQSAPFAATMTGSISVGGQTICVVNSDGVPVLFGPNMITYGQLGGGGANQRFSGQFTVTIPAGLIEMDVQTISGQAGSMAITLQFQHT